MSVIVGDIHGDIRIAKAFLAYKPETEHIALGDYVDTRNPSQVTLDDELECLDLLFASDAVLLWGNHDLTYTEARPWRCTPPHYIELKFVEKYVRGNDYLQKCLEEDGDLFVRHVFADKFQQQASRLKAAYAADGWLCTHAGVCSELAEEIPSDVLEGGATAIAAWLNDEFSKQIKVRKYCSGNYLSYGNGPLFNVNYSRGGSDHYGGIFWYDTSRELIEPYKGVKQIFAHTKTEGPDRLRIKNWINVHIEDGIWVFDSELDDFVRLG